MIYQFDLDENASIQTALEEERLKPCPPHARFIYGWMPALNEEMIYEIQGSGLICMGKEERILPRSVIQKMLAEKIETIELQHGRTVKRAEKAQMAEELEFELLPKSFCIQKRSFAILDTMRKRLIVNTSSANQGSQFTSLLRKSVPGISIEPLNIQDSLALKMTSWIKSPEQLPAQFRLGMDCILFALDNEKKKMHCKGYETLADEVIQFIDDGMAVSELSLIWNDRVQLTLTQDFTLKKVKIMEYLVDEFNEIKKQGEEQEQFDASLALASGELRLLIDDLLKLIQPKTDKAVAQQEEAAMA